MKNIFKFIQWPLIILVANFIAFSTHEPLFKYFAWFLDAVAVLFVLYWATGFIIVAKEVWQDGRKTNMQKLEEEK
ncbi:hypothetical protein [Ralstonia mannitolilytica]|uniref:hypothetical protein n=1 Tax=Ralstonia mannitolilytica TaxID=105219 RepID=UPI001C967E47|nr:hypothetical protein [Ralstonia mannitolilytica]MBY4717520.1 hypothetical protein [Ralstonia mannitolilytica]